MRGCLLAGMHMEDAALILVIVSIHHEVHANK